MTSLTLRIRAAHGLGAVAVGTTTHGIIMSSYPMLDMGTDPQRDKVLALALMSSKLVYFMLAEVDWLMREQALKQSSELSKGFEGIADAKCFNSLDATHITREIQAVDPSYAKIDRVITDLINAGASSPDLRVVLKRLRAVYGGEFRVKDAGNVELSWMWFGWIGWIIAAHWGSGCDSLYLFLGRPVWHLWLWWAMFWVFMSPTRKSFSAALLVKFITICIPFYFCSVLINTNVIGASGDTMQCFCGGSMWLMSCLVCLCSIAGPANVACFGGIGPVLVRFIYRWGIH